VANDAGELRPQPPFVVLAAAAAGAADGLTREPSGDEVGSGQVIGLDLLDVAPAGHVRPVLGQHPPAVGVDLDLADAPPPGPLQAEIQTADAGEQAKERWGGHGSPRPLGNPVALSSGAIR
jgi:hypothetical protein